ncbi:hypothetical protein N7481_000614 [Penicillium waksmanii]|uniref:uncharacterized protein n=1 Tax=Penicillium waksmanii TaxID=69791 RepID=UPI002547DF46|nr:uncharacterized protein N7481_000614 [Penicillium waksmanii]KAJ6000205.1 hypothetical protein N7481_000614 [Penicillium waksmanii]
MKTTAPFYSIFRHFTLRLTCAALFFGLSGMSRGLDEGLISTTVVQDSFVNEFGLQAKYLDASQQANRLSNITSMVHIGSIPGALIAFLLCERMGMLWSMRQLCTLWMVGDIVVITASGKLGQIYAGRFIMGLGIGQAGVVAPTYLAEIAPRSARGMLVSVFGMSEYIGIMVGWIIPQSIQIIVAGLLIMGSFLCEESPRHLCRVGKWDEARKALGKIWGLPDDHNEISAELEGIKGQLEHEQECSLYRSCVGSLKELFLSRSNLRRLLFVISSQILSQWSGANSLTNANKIEAYAPEIFSLFGIDGQSEKLFTTAIFGAVKFVASLLCAILLIDHIGRKRSLISGIIVQQVAMLYIAIYLTVNASWSGDESPSSKRAALGAIVFIYFVGIGWAMGWNTIQYLLNAEIFPLQVRATGSSLLMCFHYVNRYGLSKAVPSMLLQNSLQPEGSFWFFSTMTFFGLLWAWILLPETAGRTLEDTNGLFG